MYSLMRNDEKHAVFALVMLILVVLFLALLRYLTVFEDGSFAIGTGYPYWIAGCIPWQICGAGVGG